MVPAHVSLLLLLCLCLCLSCDPKSLELGEGGEKKKRVGGLSEGAKEVFGPPRDDDVVCTYMRPVLGDGIE